MFLREFRSLFPAGTMTTVMEVRLSPDLEYARIYLSVFPFARSGEVMAAIEGNSWAIRKSLGAKLRNQLRVVPELTFVLDETAEYIEKIDGLLGN